ncbi:MAG: hypothetical protein V2A71_06170 [Candidatus Eisenbacteria bacterium]
MDKGLRPFLKEEPKGTVQDDEGILDSIAGRIVRMGLAVPAIFFLESSKPLSFLGSQVLVFLEPFIKTFVEVKNYEKFCLLVEDRENVEKLILKVEQEEERLKEEKRERKKHERSKS